jgi:integrase/recombinase XerD
MKPIYYSIYGPLFMEYFSLKRNLGYRFSNIEYSYTQFDRFIAERNETIIGLSKELCDVWCARRPNESPKGWYTRIRHVRQFSSYLITIGYSSYIPALPKIKANYIPYIYSEAEIGSIFNAADQLKTNFMCNNSMVLVMPCLLRVLYGSGIRLSEALTLSYNDVNFDEKTITLRHTKNGSDRLVPISESLSQVIQDYLKARKQFPIRRLTNLVFVHPNGSSCYPTTAYRWFRKVLSNASIPFIGNHQGPHLHDLRHTFSVHSLAKMSEQGVDLYYSLPILSTYLGHSSISSTNEYVRLTSEMYPSILSKVNNICPYLFPSIYEEASNENC